MWNDEWERLWRGGENMDSLKELLLMAVVLISNLSVYRLTKNR